MASSTIESNTLLVTSRNTMRRKVDVSENRFNDFPSITSTSSLAAGVNPESCELATMRASSAMRSSRRYSSGIAV
jgi:hypothetical protein